MPIVGTAGHVDHGKSTLVEALTGRDPDRWAEEKERGLTIDLGFAWASIEGIDVGFVDVPGHERFIKNMLAGVGAIDCALLVVAADSGWMPQTEEHASVLDLLAVNSGVIALTRIDLVDEDLVELATLEVMEKIEGTGLESWPIVPVSAITGKGMPSLIDAIGAAITTESMHADRPFKMWIDRAFVVSGAGVVVTGTISQGSVSIGDDVEILPGGSMDRVRGVHHHDQPTEMSGQGSRTAINLQSSKRVVVPRGSLVCTPGSLATTTRLLAQLRPARQFEEIPQRGAFHMHVGSAHSPTTIRRLFGTDTYLLALRDELPMVMGDRFILRDSGRQTVVGGGRVIDPQAPITITEPHIDILTSAIDGTRVERANALAAVGRISKLNDIWTATGGAAPSDALIAGAFAVSHDALTQATQESIDVATAYHDDHPLRPGVPKVELGNQVDLDPEVVDALIDATDLLEQAEGFVRLADFRDALSQAQVDAWDSVKADLELSFDVPRMTAIDLEQEILHAVIRRGDLIQIAPDLVFTKQQVDEIHEGLQALGDRFSVTEFKESFGMTRRQAVPTLEWLDTTGWTKRSGDERTVRRRTN